MSRDDDTHLQDGQLVHILPLTRRNHVFEHTELFVHLRSPPSFDQAVGCLPCDLASSSSVAFARILLATSRLRSGI